MSDPRYTDPRYSDPRLSDPVLRRDDSVGGMWGWIAGIGVIVLIAFLLIAGWSNNNETAGTNPPATSSTATRQITPPATTGQGSLAPRPTAPAPSAPPKSGAQ